MISILKLENGKESKLVIEPTPEAFEQQIGGYPGYLFDEDFCVVFDEEGSFKDLPLTCVYRSSTGFIQPLSGTVIVVGFNRETTEFKSVPKKTLTEAGVFRH